MKFLAFIGLCLFSAINANAHFETATTIYYVTKENDDMVLVKINKDTLTETTRNIPLKKHAHSETYLFSNDDQTMYLTSQCNKDLVVFNHRTGKTVRRVKFDNEIQSFFIHGNYGYALIGRSSSRDRSLKLIDLTTYVITPLVLPNPEENQEQSHYKKDVFFIHNAKGYLLSTFHTKLYTLDLTTNTFDPNPYQLNQNCTCSSQWGNYVFFSRCQSMEVKLDLWDIETKAKVLSLDKALKLNILGIYKNKLYYIYDKQDDILIYDFTTHLTTTIPFKNSNYTGHNGYTRNEYLYISLFDLSTRMTMFYIINMDEETVDPSLFNLSTGRPFTTEIFNRHLYQGFTKVVPLLPSKAELMGPHLAHFFADFKAFNPEPFQLGDIRKHHASLTQNDFDVFPIYVLFHELFSKLPAVDCLSILFTMQNPKNRLESVPGQEFLRKVIYKELMLNLLKKKNDEAKAMIKYLVQFGDPLITPLASFTTHEQHLAAQAPQPAAVVRSNQDRRVRRKLN